MESETVHGRNIAKWSYDALGVYRCKTVYSVFVSIFNLVFTGPLFGHLLQLWSVISLESDCQVMLYISNDSRLSQTIRLAAMLLLF